MHNTVYLERLKGTNGIIQKDTDKSNGMPTSCKDLYILGHQLNGFYLIKAFQPKQGTKIETIFCDFTNATRFNLNGRPYNLKK